ncbi:MAG: hypothetical protein ABEI27_12145 [Halobellus sp.]|uniref:DUF7859 family protein n=1 Tax=Halobellus sp. TaxID=1979212 RepID=UPI0035D4996C
MITRQPGLIGRSRPVEAGGDPAQVDVAVDFIASNPALILLVAFLLTFVFFAYLFVRRTLTGLRDGFDEGYRGK